MQQTALVNAVSSSPGTVPAHKKETPPSPPGDGYALLLQQIGERFGFSERQAGDLVQQTYAHSHNRDTVHRFSRRVGLAKILVHKCIFTISTELFLQPGPASQKDRPASLDYSCRHAAALQRMPLSFRAVYILNHVTGFTERETAEILNTSVLE